MPQPVMSQHDRYTVQWSFLECCQWVEASGAKQQARLGANGRGCIWVQPLPASSYRRHGGAADREQGRLASYLPRRKVSQERRTQGVASRVEGRCG